MYTYLLPLSFTFMTIFITRCFNILFSFLFLFSFFFSFIIFFYRGFPVPPAQNHLYQTQTPPLPFSPSGASTQTGKEIIKNNQNSIYSNTDNVTNLGSLNVTNNLNSSAGLHGNSTALQRVPTLNSTPSGSGGVLGVKALGSPSAVPYSLLGNVSNAGRIGGE